ncbi:MAG: TIGR03862 family flavoprotein [Gemmobacter sp.]
MEARRPTTGRSAVVVGAGPAGLMAAGELAAAGLSVTVADAMPTVGRKFLMAGKSGLNLTRDEPLSSFAQAYDEAAEWLWPMLAAFGPDRVQDWARNLGQPVFTGSSGRVFPVAMKASPLLRAWVGRLKAEGVTLHTRWRWSGFDGAGLAFDTPRGRVLLRPDVAVLALGGASWARLGSDGSWTRILADAGVLLAPFRPANMGFCVDWSAHMERHHGQPVKGTELIAGERRVRAEFVISRRGLEGGGIYGVSRAVRDGASLALDLLPDRSLDEIVQRLASRGKATLSHTLANRLRLDPARLALVQEFGRPLPSDPAALAALLKALPVRHAGPRPMDEAISTAGGVCRLAVDAGLQLRVRPGVFVAGEMLDWEAPTGGYLLTACLATGRWAGRAAAGLDPNQ